MLKIMPRIRKGRPSPRREERRAAADRRTGRDRRDAKIEVAAEAIAEAAANLLESRNEELQQIERTRMARWFFGALFLAMLVLIGMMAFPYANAAVIGLIVAGAFYPLLDWLMERFALSRTAAAWLVTTIVLVVVFVPLIYVISELVTEAADFYDRVSVVITTESVRELFFGRGWAANAGRQLFGYFNVPYTPQRLESLLLELLQGATTTAVSRINSLLGNLLDLLLQSVIMLVVIYGMLRHGPIVKRFLVDLSPLPKEETELLISRFNQMNYVTMAGNGIGGVMQGGLAGLAFWALGFESTLLWTVIMAILAFLPVIGMSIVYIPASIYLLFQERYISALFLFVFCGLVSLIVENWFKSIFVGASVQINAVVVLLSIVGGLSAFGPAGIFYGPLIITLFLTIVDLYHTQYARVFNERL